MITIIYLLILSSALVYLPFFPTEEFETPKSLVLLTVSSLSLGVVPYRRFLQDKVAIAGLLFVISAIVSAIFSLEIPMSVFGNSRMPNGVLITASYLILYVIGSEHLKTEKLRMSCIRVMLASSFIVSLYAVIQATGHDFKPWYGLPEEHGFQRPASLIGHPNFMAAYLSMIIPYVIYLLKTSEIKIERIIALITGLLSVGSIFFSQSRGMWWALGAGVGAYLYLSKATIKQWITTAIIGIAILGSVISTSRPVRETVFERAGLLINLGGPRVEYLKAATRIWLKYPVLGAGTDAFEIAFDHERSPKYWLIERGGSPHRAHNEYLNILATMGLIGAISGLFLLLSIYNKIRHSTSDLMIPASASIVAFLVQEISSFHCIATVIVLILSTIYLSEERD